MQTLDIWRHLFGGWLTASCLFSRITHRFISVHISVSDRTVLYTVKCDEYSEPLILVNRCSVTRVCVVGFKGIINIFYGSHCCLVVVAIFFGVCNIYNTVLYRYRGIYKTTRIHSKNSKKLILSSLTCAIKKKCGKKKFPMIFLFLGGGRWETVFLYCIKIINDIMHR